MNNVQARAMPMTPAGQGLSAPGNAATHMPTSPTPAAGMPAAQISSAPSGAENMSTTMPSVPVMVIQGISGATSRLAGTEYSENEGLRATNTGRQAICAATAMAVPSARNSGSQRANLSASLRPMSTIPAVASAESWNAASPAR